MKKGTRPHVQHNQGTKKHPAATAREKEPQTSRKGGTMMQHCPGCGSQLPDKASFCAHCGYALDATNDQESQTLDKPESPTALAKSEKQQDSQDVSALPGIPPLDEDQDAERSMALILPISQDTLSPAETNGTHEEAQP